MSEAAETVKSPSEGWKTKKLEDVVDILDSQRVPINAKERETRQGPVPYYGATGQVGWIDDHIFDEELVLLGEDGAPFLDSSKQKAYLVRGKSWVNNHAHVLRAKDGIPNAYIKHYLDRVDYHQYVSGTTRLKLNQHRMREIPIPIAPKGQRARIVAEIEKQFSRLDKAVASLKRVKANLKRYKVAVLKAAVEGKLTEEWRKQNPDVEPASKLLERILAERRAKWEEAELAKMKANGKEPENDKWKEKYKEPQSPESVRSAKNPHRWVVCRTDQLFWFVTSGSRGWAKYYSDSGSIFLRMGNLDHDVISLDLSDIQHVNPPAGSEGMRTRFQENDILVSITADVGMIGVIPPGIGNGYINQHISLARPVEVVDSSYLAWFLASEQGQTQFQKLQRGATKAGLGLDDIRAIDVTLPSLKEQGVIVDDVSSRLSVIDKLETEMSSCFQLLDRFRQSVLDVAFGGALSSKDSSSATDFKKS